MSIDLRPFGLYWDLDPEKMVTPVPSAYRTASVKRSEDSIKFFGSGGEEILKLDLDKELGRGAYGKTYLTKNKINGFTAVVKIIGRSPSYSTMDVITEVISQIIVVKTTEGTTYNLKTPTNGNVGDVLQTDGAGSTFWGVGAPPSSGITFRQRRRVLLYCKRISGKQF